jgi:ATP-binding cassette, subfamily B, bacterial
VARVPFVPQMQASECGLACLAMVLAHHGAHVSLAELRERGGVARDGLSADRMVSLAEGLGMEAGGYRLEVEDLQDGDLEPCVLHWNLDHFVVAERGSKEGLRIVDPAAGRRTVGWGEVGRSFSGICIRFSPGEGFKKRKPSASSSFSWTATIRDLVPTVAWVFAVGFLFDLVAFVFAGMAGAFVDNIAPTRSLVLLLSLSAAALVIAFARSGYAAARLRVVDGLRAKVEEKVSRALTERLFSLDATFFLHRAAGDLASRVKGIMSLRETLLSVAQAAFDLMLAIVYVGVLFFYSAKLAALVGFFVLVRLAIGAHTQRALRDNAVHATVASSEVGSVFVQAFGQLEVTKAFRLEDYFLRKLDVARGKELAAVAAGGEVRARNAAVLASVEYLSLGAMMLVGGSAIQSGNLSMGALASFIAVEALVAGRATAATGVLSEVSRVRPVVERLADILDAVPEPRGSVRANDLRMVEICDASFHFDPAGPPILANASLRVGPGEHVALVGRSGSGKSTLLRMVLGLLRPSSGVVRVGGADVASLDVEHLRARLGFVPAASHVFDGSLAYNIALESGASDARVRETLRALRLDLDPSRDGTPLLSAGQAQRLVLARAMVKRPQLYVLDEATSALDDDTEESVLRHLAAQGASILSATHRVAAMRAANRIVVLERGRVVDEGSYEELSRRSAAFRRATA